MIKVFHSNNPRDTMFFGGEDIITNEKILEMLDGDGYKHVADVETDSLETAYRLTNHIDSDWKYNEGVINAVNGKVRSSSVGDVFIDDDGNAHVVASIGFEKIKDGEK